MEFSRKSRRDYVLAALEKFERHLTHYAARMLHGNSDQAEDAVQHTFMKLCEQKTGWPEDQLKAWLFTVCRNRIIDDARKNGRMKTREPRQMEKAASSTSEAGQYLEDQERLICLKQQIELMPDQEREIIDLWSHGFKHHEIARITSRKRGTIRVQLHRAIKSLKDKMAEIGTSRNIKP